MHTEKMRANLKTESNPNLRTVTRVRRLPGRRTAVRDGLTVGDVVAGAAVGCSSTDALAPAVAVGSSTSIVGSVAGSSMAGSSAVIDILAPERF